MSIVDSWDEGESMQQEEAHARSLDEEIQAMCKEIQVVHGQKVNLVAICKDLALCVDGLHAINKEGQVGVSSNFKLFALSIQLKLGVFEEEVILGAWVQFRCAEET